MVWYIYIWRDGEGRDMLCHSVCFVLERYRSEGEGGLLEILARGGGSPL